MRTTDTLPIPAEVLAAEDAYEQGARAATGEPVRLSMTPERAMTIARQLAHWAQLVHERSTTCPGAYAHVGLDVPEGQPRIRVRIGAEP